MISKVSPPDIAIVGGGPCGLTLAGILERAGFDYVLYERGSWDEIPRGGCLDLHVGSGQKACREAGCFDLMRQLGRLGDATESWVWSHKGEKINSWGKGRDAPELDRADIKKALLTTIPPEKILWKTEVIDSTRDEAGQITLHFADGTTAEGFKMVVGADGVRSKIRHLIHPIKPEHSGTVFVTGHIYPNNPFYGKTKEMAGIGPMAILGRHTFTWIQMQGDGKYRVDFGIVRAEPYPFKESVLNDADAMKKTLLSEDFKEHWSDFQDMIKALEGPFRIWPLWKMPLETFPWDPVPGVTLIGDAAHVTTPYVGDGVNCGMRDAMILVKKLQEFGITTEAIAAYEREMFVFAIDVIERSDESGTYFYDYNAPTTFFEGLNDFYKRTGHLLIGKTDDY